MNDKNLILHIGSPKTGTTAIQNFLYYNREKINSQGFYYPEKYSYPGHIRVQSVVFHTLFNVNYPYLMNKKSKYFKKFIETVNSNNIKNIIISYEGLSAGILKGYSLSGSNPPTKEDLINNINDYVAVMNEENVSAFKKFIEENFENIGSIQIIYYCRRQDLFFDSLYKELLSQNILFSLEDFKDIYNIILNCDHYSIIEIWSKIFGKDNIIVRPYEKCQLINGDIIDDFCSTTGIDKTCLDEIQPQKSNIGWNNYSSYLWRLMQISDPSISSNWAKYEYYRNQISQLKFENKKTNPLLSPEERLAIIHKYDKSNSLLVKEFLKKNEGSLFKEEYPDLNESWESQVLNQEEIVKCCLSIQPDIFKWRIYAFAQKYLSFLKADSKIKEILNRLYMKHI